MASPYYKEQIHFPLPNSLEPGACYHAFDLFSFIFCQTNKQFDGFIIFIAALFTHQVSKDCRFQISHSGVHILKNAAPVTLIRNDLLLRPHFILCCFLSNEQQSVKKFSMIPFIEILQSFNILFLI